MAKQTINQGTAPTGAGGDTFRSGSAKLQANDNELYNWIGNGSSVTTLPASLPVAKGGTGATTAAAARTNLGLGTAATADLATSNLDDTVGRVMRVGDFGIGRGIAWSVSPDTFKRTLLGGVYIAGDPNHNTIRGYINVAYSNDWVWQLRSQISSTGVPQHRCFYEGATWGGWKSFYTEQNATKDSNGFLKAASPIVKLYADRIELNDEAEQQDIVFEKLEIGDYLIKGSSGFAQEGWYVETPKDANGNVLFSVIYTTLENGDISVKTYKKKFDLETASIVADLDNPVDITEKRWIDLRLQELPQPEIEVTDAPEQ